MWVFFWRSGRRKDGEIVAIDSPDALKSRIGDDVLDTALDDSSDDEISGNSIVTVIAAANSAYRFVCSMDDMIVSLGYTPPDSG